MATSTSGTLTTQQAAARERELERSKQIEAALKRGEEYTRKKQQEQAQKNSTTRTSTGNKEYDEALKRGELYTEKKIQEALSKPGVTSVRSGSHYYSKATKSSNMMPGTGDINQIDTTPASMDVAKTQTGYKSVPFERQTAEQQLQTSLRVSSIQAARESKAREPVYVSRLPTSQEQLKQTLEQAKLEQLQTKYLEKEYFKRLNTFGKIDYLAEREAKKFPDIGAGSGGKLFVYAGAGLSKVSYDVFPFALDKKDLTNIKVPFLYSQSGEAISFKTKIPLKETSVGTIELVKDISPLTIAGGVVIFKTPLQKTISSAVENPIRFAGETAATTLFFEGLISKTKGKIPQILKNIGEENLKIAGETFFEKEPKVISKTGGLEIFKGEDILKVENVYQTTKIKSSKPTPTYSVGEIKYGESGISTFVQDGKQIFQETQFNTIFDGKLKPYQLISETGKGITTYKLYELQKGKLKFIESYVRKDVNPIINIGESFTLAEQKYKPIRTEGVFESTFEQSNILKQQRASSKSFNYDVKGGTLTQIQSNLFVKTKKFGQNIGYEREIELKINPKDIFTELESKRNVKSIEIIPTKYEFVDFPVAEKNVIINIEGKNVFAEFPTKSEVKQFSDIVSSEFEFDISKKKYTNLKLSSLSLDYGRVGIGNYFKKGLNVLQKPINYASERFIFETELSKFGTKLKDYIDYNLNIEYAKKKLNKINIPEIAESKSGTYYTRDFSQIKQYTDKELSQAAGSEVSYGDLSLLQQPKITLDRTIQIQRPEINLPKYQLKIPSYDISSPRQVRFIGIINVNENRFNYSKENKIGIDFEKSKDINRIPKFDKDIFKDEINEQLIYRKQIPKPKFKPIQELKQEQRLKQIPSLKQEQKYKQDVYYNFGSRFKFKYDVYEIPKIPIIIPSFNNKLPKTNLQIKNEKTKKTKYKFSGEEKYVIPDLFSVSVTEAATGKEAVAPKITKGVRTIAYAERGGYGFGLTPTRQLQMGRVRFKK